MPARRQDWGASRTETGKRTAWHHRTSLLVFMRANCRYFEPPKVSVARPEGDLNGRSNVTICSTRTRAGAHKTCLQSWLLFSLHSREQAWFVDNWKLGYYFRRQTSAVVAKYVLYARWTQTHRRTMFQSQVFFSISIWSPHWCFETQDNGSCFMFLIVLRMKLWMRAEQRRSGAPHIRLQKAFRSPFDKVE